MFTYYNANPAGIQTGDCAYRALSSFLATTWMQALLNLVLHAANKGRVNFTYITNITSFLQSKGYKRQKPPHRMTVRKFIENVALEGKAYFLTLEHPRHATFISPDKELLDIGDCSDKYVKYYWER